MADVAWRLSRAWRRVDMEDITLRFPETATVGSVFEEQVNRNSDREFLVYPDKGIRYTYGQADERAARLARGLMAIGIEKGEHVGIWAANVPEWTTYMLAATKIGAVLTPINISYKSAELEYVLKQSDMKAKENHDTIGMVALDAMNDVAGACTTSGLAWKIHGRVGDSPIIGAGMYVDNEVGGAASTGVGEECIKVNGSFLVVETMRHGASPEEACMEAVKRIAKRHKEKPDFQIAFLALNKKGDFGGFALNDGFEYAVMFDGENKLMKSESLY